MELKPENSVFVVVHNAHMIPEVVCRTLDLAVHAVGVLTAKAFKEGSNASYRIIETPEVVS